MSDRPTPDTQQDIKSWLTPELGAPSPATAVARTADDGKPANQQKQPAISEADVQRVFAEAKQAGYAEGLSKGIEQGLAQAVAEAAPLVSLADKLARPLQDLDEKVIAQMVTLVKVVAGQLVRREMKENPGEIVALVREGISILPSNNQRISIKLHPEDAKLIRLSLGEQDAEHHWEIVDDLSLERGGCHIISDKSTIDGRLESRLNTIVVSMLGDQRAAIDDSTG